MKSIKNLKATVTTDGKITMTGDIVDFTPSFKIQQVTVGNVSPHNASFLRHCQLSHECFITTQMSNGVAILLDEWLPIAIQIEPKLASYPTFAAMPSRDNLKAVVNSETPVEFQWSGSVDAKSFKFIQGQTADALDLSQIGDSKFVIVSVKNSTGQTDSDMIKI